MEQSSKKILLKLLIPWLLFFAALVFAGYLLLQIKSLENQLSQQITQSPQNEVSALVNAVGKVIVLPTDEVPTIATVTDLSKLAGQAFFANAKVGDKVLMYTKAQKAILYDPIANKIIELAPFNTGTDNTSATSTGTSTSLHTKLPSQ